MKTSDEQGVFESADLWELKPEVDEFIPQNPKASRIGERLKWRENKGKGQYFKQLILHLRNPSEVMDNPPLPKKKISLYSLERFN